MAKKLARKVAPKQVIVVRVHVGDVVIGPNGEQFTVHGIGSVDDLLADSGRVSGFRVTASADDQTVIWGS